MFEMILCAGMSAIDFSREIQREADSKGDRMKVMLSRNFYRINLVDSRFGSQIPGEFASCLSWLYGELTGRCRLGCDFALALPAVAGTGRKFVQLNWLSS
ncbi:hypothetical protein [Undibacterium sp. Jales W-56]|uniref:hypothetical protein n=1 Tax=Undibacterium sp. Jales W-56 TaxID=2897325 RepID=UPI0039772E8B